MTAQQMAIGDRLVGQGAPVFVIAEAGVNHDGELVRALELVDAAARAGADAVKFQTFEPDALVTAAAPLAPYQRDSETTAAGQRELLERLCLSAADFARLAEHCASRGLLFLSTPFDADSAALLVELGVPAFKVGSGELTNIPFLRDLSSRGLPLLLSTGMATLDEVSHALDAIQDAGCKVVLLHCTSSYPAPPEEANLRAIDTLRAAFGVPVGYSDHSLGFAVSLAAVARDACVVERHLTLDRHLAGPDHAMSLEPDELGELIRQIRSLEAMLGDGCKRPQPSEGELLLAARRSIVAARPLAAGEVLSAAALAVKRPGGGMPPSSLESLVGARLARPLAADEQLTSAHLEPRP